MEAASIPETPTGAPPRNSAAQWLSDNVLWVLLGWLSWHGLPGATSATGAIAPRILGRFSPGHAPLRLPEPATTPVRRMLLRTLDRPLAGRTR